MNHKQMNAELAGLCGQLGVYCWINAREMFQNSSGWVDAVALGSRGALFIENKTAEGRRTRPQIRTAGLLVASGFEYRLYRPEHYQAGTVRQDLEAIV